MKKTETIERIVCDLCIEEGKVEDVEAIGKTEPSGKDVCFEHQKSLLKEVRYPKEMGGEMSGFKIATDNGFTPVMIIKYKEKANA
jgi:hypothetical protein